MVQAIIKLAIRFRFNLPAYYTLIVRSLCSLEGLALRVDPSFSIVNAAIPIILRRLLTDTRKSAVSLLRELLLEDDATLRIGMLEGLLRNYSTEAGKVMAKAPADNVVLKGVTVESAEPAAVAGSRVRIGSTASGRVENTGTEAGMATATVRVADASQVDAATVGGAVPGSSMNGAAQKQNGAGRSDVPQSIGMTAGDSVAPVVRPPQDSAAQPEASASKVDVDNTTRGPSAEDSLEAQVVQMVLSAPAAGVRRVLMQADMLVCSCANLHCSTPAIAKQGPIESSTQRRSLLQRRDLIGNARRRYGACAGRGAANRRQGR